MTVLTSDLVMEDGYKTIIDIDGLTGAKFFEKEVTPGEFSANGTINTTHMRTTGGWRTHATKKMKSLGDTQVKVSYAGAAIAQILAILGIPKLITLTFPAGDTLQYWGSINKFAPGTFKEGEQPEGTLELTSGLVNPATGVAVAPLWTAGPAVT